MKKRYLIPLTTIACFLVMTIAAYQLGINRESVAKASYTLEQFRYLLAALRLTAIALLWYFWEPLCDRLYHSAITHYQQKRQTLSALRHRVALCFVAIELLLAQNLLGKWLGMIV